LPGSTAHSPWARWLGSESSAYSAVVEFEKGMPSRCHARRHWTEWGADVGSASWILQVLAALAGAVTAGAVAWFLIGRRPEDAAARGWRVWTQLLLVPPVFSEKRPFGSPRNVGSFI